MKRKSGYSGLRALAAGLILLVMMLAPLHAHAAAPEASSTCLLCEVSHRVLDLPVDDPVLALQPAPLEGAAADSAPRLLPRADARDGRPSNPRAPPLHS